MLYTKILVQSETWGTHAGMDSKGVRPVRVGRFTGTRDSGFSGLACAAGGGSNSCLGWVSWTWIQHWPTVNEARSQKESKGLGRRRFWVDCSQPAHLAAPPPHLPTEGTFS